MKTALAILSLFIALAGCSTLKSYVPEEPLLQYNYYENKWEVVK